MPNVSYAIQEDDVHYNKESNSYVILTGKSVEWGDYYEMVIYNRSGDQCYISGEDEFEKIIVDGVERDHNDEGAWLYGDLTFENDTEQTQHEIKFKLTGDTLPSCCFSEMSVGEDYIITLPESVTSIGYCAFCYNDALKEVIIPDSVTSIGNYAFNNSENLESVIIEATTPPQLAKDYEGEKYGHFNNTTCTIYVPAASVNVYKAAEGWSEYASRIQAIS